MIIAHDLGYRSFYGHLHAPKVEMGQKVPREEPIASARPTSPVCLRLGVILPGTNRISDPTLFLPPIPNIDP